MKEHSKCWFVYLIRCEDNSLYCGVTTDIQRRLLEHKEGTGSKYLRSKSIVGIAASSGPFTKSNAMQEEYRVKQLSKDKKEELVHEWN